ncbi:MAG: lipoprotein [Terricaulis sp.]
MTRLLLMGAALVLLAGCGLKGGLEQPPPMWGESRTEYLREQEAQAEARRLREERERAQNPVAPGASVEPSPAPIPSSPTDSAPNPQ